MTNSSSELIDYFIKQKSSKEVTMGMGSGGGRGEVTSDINVTPMADVMLVLLIIFMVVTPMLQKGVSVDLAKTNNPIEMKEADTRRCRTGRDLSRRQVLYQSGRSQHR